MPSAADPLLAPLPVDLPAVERASRMPAGFVATGTSAGIKASGRPDFALVVATEGPVPAAAVFTPNRFAAAPVRLSRANLQATGGAGVAAGYASVVIATSGSANAATGPAGDADQAAIGQAVAGAIGALPEHVLHLSTGVIGTRLPVAKVVSTIGRVVAEGLEVDRPRAGAGGRLAAHDGLDHQDGQRARRGSRGRRRHGHRDRDRHRQGRRDDPPAHGDDALDRPHRRHGVARHAAGPAAPGRRDHMGPALGGRGHQHQRHGVPARVGRRGCRLGGHGRSRPGGARRRDPGRRARPGAPAGPGRRGRDGADHLSGRRRRRRCRRAGDRPRGHRLVAGQGRGPRPRRELGTDRRRRGQRGRRRGRGARGRRPRPGRGRVEGRPAGSRGPRPAPDRDRRPRRLRRCARRPSGHRQGGLPGARWAPRRC